MQGCCHHSIIRNSAQLWLLQGCCHCLVIKLSSDFLKLLKDEINFAAKTQNFCFLLFSRKRDFADSTTAALLLWKKNTVVNTLLQLLLISYEMEYLLSTPKQLQIPAVLEKERCCRLNNSSCFAVMEKEYSSQHLITAPSKSVKFLFLSDYSVKFHKLQTSLCPHNVVSSVTIPAVLSYCCPRD